MRQAMLLVMGLFLFCLTVFVAGVSEMTPVGYEIKDCTLFPSNVTYIDRDIWITRSISCDEDKILIIPRGIDILLHTRGPLRLHRLHFAIQRGARLTLTSVDGPVTFARHKETRAPVFAVAGQFYLFDLREESADDKPIKQVFVPSHKQRLLTVAGSGRIYSEDTIEYTLSGIAFGGSAGDATPVAPAQTTESTPTDKSESESEPTDRLKVGEVLRDRSLRLTSADCDVELYANEHGSLVFAKYSKKLSKKKIETTLVPATISKVMKMLEFRAMVEAEAANEGDSDVENKQSGQAWTPWGIRRNRRLQRARDHAGEVDVAVDHQGCVEVSIDGSCVLSRSGQYSWEWVNKCAAFCRKRCLEYELHVVEDGLQVQLQGRKVWGLSVPKDDAEKARGQTFWGIPAADIE